MTGQDVASMMTSATWANSSSTSLLDLASQFKAIIKAIAAWWNAMILAGHTQDQQWQPPWPTTVDATQDRRVDGLIQLVLLAVDKLCKGAFLNGVDVLTEDAAFGKRPTSSAFRDDLLGVFRTPFAFVLDEVSGAAVGGSGVAGAVLTSVAVDLLGRLTWAGQSSTPHGYYTDGRITKLMVLKEYEDKFAAIRDLQEPQKALREMHCLLQKQSKYCSYLVNSLVTLKHQLASKKPGDPTLATTGVALSRTIQKLCVQLHSFLKLLTLFKFFAESESHPSSQASRWFHELVSNTNPNAPSSPLLTQQLPTLLKHIISQLCENGMRWLQNDEAIAAGAFLVEAVFSKEEQLLLVLVTRFLDDFSSVVFTSNEVKHDQFRVNILSKVANSFLENLKGGGRNTSSPSPIFSVKSALESIRVDGLRSAAIFPAVEGQDGAGEQQQEKELATLRSLFVDGADTNGAFSPPPLEAIATANVPANVEEEEAPQQQSSTKVDQMAREPVIVKPAGAAAPPGLLNCGNTCFANAVIQMLYRCARFRNAFVNVALSPKVWAALTRNGEKQQLPPGEPTTVRFMLGLLLGKLAWHGAMTATGGSFVDPFRFIDLLPSPFNSRRQEDASEFSKVLLALCDFHDQQSSTVPATKEGDVAQPPPQKGDAKADEDATNVGDSSIDDELSKTVGRYMGGEWQQTITCGECGTESVRPEQYWDLSLPLEIPTAPATPTPPPADEAPTVRDPSLVLVDEERSTPPPSSPPVVTIASLLNETFGPPNEEHLVGDSRYQCDVCNKRTDAIKKVLLNGDKTPPYLTLQLNRFYFSRKTLNREKVFDAVPIEESIDVPVVDAHREQMTTDGSSGELAAKRMKSEAAEGSETTTSNDRGDALKATQRYQLAAIVIHSGASPASGHYFTLVRQKLKPSSLRSAQSSLVANVEGGDLPLATLDHDAKWFKCNDSMVTELSTAPSSYLHDILTKGRHGQYDTPYLLLYERCDVREDHDAPDGREHAQQTTAAELLTEESSIQFPHEVVAYFENEQIYAQQKRRKEEQDEEERRKRLNSQQPATNAQWFKPDDDEDDGYGGVGGGGYHIGTGGAFGFGGGGGGGSLIM